MSKSNEVIVDNIMSNKSKDILIKAIYDALSGVSYSNIEDILYSVRKKASENATYSVS